MLESFSFLPIIADWFLCLQLYSILSLNYFLIFEILSYLRKCRPPRQGSGVQLFGGASLIDPRGASRVDLQYRQTISSDFADTFYLHMNVRGKYRRTVTPSTDCAALGGCGLLSSPHDRSLIRTRQGADFNFQYFILSFLKPSGICNLIYLMLSLFRGLWNL